MNWREMRFTRHLLVDFRCCVWKAALMHSKSCPLLPFRIPLTSTRFLNYACHFKGRVPNQGGLSTQWKIELSGCVEPLLLRYPGTAQSFSKRQPLWYQTSTDLSVIVSLGCPNTEFLFPLLFSCSYASCGPQWFSHMYAKTATFWIIFSAYLVTLSLFSINIWLSE